MRRFLRLALAGLGLVGIVAVVSAQAAGNTKPYTANVRVESAATPNTFRLSLTNDPKAQQSLGSANFTLPPNFSAPQGPVPAANVSSPNFNVTVVGNIVQFRATSSSTSLAAGATVYADVTVTIPASPNCTTGAWTVQAKQSNDFSGAPGNFMSLSPASDLTPLGSFVFAPIVTALPGGVNVPQILTNTAAPIGITALDTCGNPDSDYSGATLAPLAANPARLVNAAFTGLSWSGGGNTARTGSATMTPTDVEVLDNVVVSDPTTQISQTSNSFDVVEKICAVSGSTCTWSNKKGTITATSTVGASNGGTASLGLGFRSVNAVCTIAGKATGSIGDLVQIVPLNYSAGGTYTVTLTYAKSIAPNGPASGFNVCKNSDPDGGGTWSPIAPCARVPVAPCALTTKVSGGALQVTLYLEPGDPLSGGFG